MADAQCYLKEKHMHSRLTVPELFPEASGHIVLQTGRGEVTEDDLQMPQHSDVVLLTVLGLIERGLVIKLLMITEHIIPGVHITLQHNDVHQTRSNRLHLCAKSKVGYRLNLINSNSDTDSAYRVRFLSIPSFCL